MFLQKISKPSWLILQCFSRAGDEHAFPFQLHQRGDRQGDRQGVINSTTLDAPPKFRLKG